MDSKKEMWICGVTQTLQFLIKMIMNRTRTNKIPALWNVLFAWKLLKQKTLWVQCPATWCTYFTQVVSDLGSCEIKAVLYASLNCTSVWWHPQANLLCSKIQDIAVATQVRTMEICQWKARDSKIWGLNTDLINF